MMISWIYILCAIVLLPDMYKSVDGDTNTARHVDCGHNNIMVRNETGVNQVITEKDFHVSKGYPSFYSEKQLQLKRLFQMLNNKQQQNYSNRDANYKNIGTRPSYYRSMQTDPDAKRNLTELIMSQGYPVDRYLVRTKDGFLLDLHRIPRGKDEKNNEHDVDSDDDDDNNNNDNNNNNDEDNYVNDIKDKELLKNYENAIRQNSKNVKKVTSDILKSIIHRKSNNSIFSTGSKPAVFIQHGYLSSACDFVMNFANDSLAFVLADAGYDVWLGNSRGNTYSRQHVNLHVNDTQFWDWSIDEMAEYDTSAFIDFILNKTSQSSLHYIGHSQGTILAFALLSEKPDYQKKIRSFVGLAPIMSLAHMKSPMKHLAKVKESLIFDLLGRNECFPSTNKTKRMAVTVCASPVTRLVFYAMLFMSNGPDISNLNQTRLPVYMSHTPAGTSVKTLVHYAQMIREKRFAKYDYGSPSANIEKYGQPIPPTYNVSSIRVPTLLFSASKDWLADPTDVSVLESTLPNIRYSYKYPSWNHMDFVLGMDASDACYSRILKYLPQF